MEYVTQEIPFTFIFYITKERNCFVCLEPKARDKNSIHYHTFQKVRVADGWLPWLRAIAAIAMLTEVAKLILGYKLEILTPCWVRAILETIGYLWLMGEHLAKYQAMLLEKPQVIIKTCTILNLSLL